MPNHPTFAPRGVCFRSIFCLNCISIVTYSINRRQLPMILGGALRDEMQKKSCKKRECVLIDFPRARVTFPIRSLSYFVKNCSARQGAESTVFPLDMERFTLPGSRPRRRPRSTRFAGNMRCFSRVRGPPKPPKVPVSPCKNVIRDCKKARVLPRIP